LIVNPWGGVVSTISGSGVIDVRKGERCVAERCTIIRNVSLNSGGSDDRGSVIRACTRYESAICPDAGKRKALLVRWAREWLPRAIDTSC